MNIKDDASLAMIPVAYKEDKLYSVIPNDDDGDFDFSRSSKGTRVNKGGFIEEMDNDIPRLDYPLLNGVVQDCPTLLLEPERTQLAEYTNAISSANGYILTNGTLTTNDDIAPDGSNHASTFKSTSANGQFQKVKTGSSGTEYTVSAYVKRKTGTGKVYLRAVENTNTEVTIYDYWTRVSLTVTSTSTSIRYGIALETSGDEVYVWGFQVEVGSYPTSLIPNTSTGEITRLVDNAQIASGAEDIIGSQNEGTLFIDLEIPYDTTSSDYFQFSISDQNALDNRVFINFRSGKAQFQVFSGNPTVGVGFCDTPTPKNIRLKIAGSYETDNFVLFKDGFLADDIDTGGTVNFTTQMESIRFADQGNGLKFQAKVYETMFFKEALTQSELEALTSYDSFKEMATQQLYTVE
jgi:hypothetical protein